MLKQILVSPGRRLVALTLSLFVALLAGFLVGRASAAQPHLQAALHHLRAAKGELEVAEHNTGGHRVKALNLVNEAIGEVEAGMAAAAGH
jgi:hypothetical protein